MMMKRVLSICVLTALCWGVLPRSSSAQTAGPQITVQLAWGGYTRLPGWTEAFITLTNEQSTWEGTLEIYDAAKDVTYKTSVNLPQQSRQSLRMPVFTTGNFDLTLILKEERGSSQEIKLPVTSLDDQRVCAVYSSRLPSSAFTFNACDTLISLQSLETVPEMPMAWDTVDVLILNGLSANAFTDQQAENLITWVASGGHLVVAGGLALNSTLQALPEGLRIASAGPVIQMGTLPDILPGQDTIAGAQLVADVKAVPLVKSEGRVFAASRKIARGVVDVIGWDMTHMENTSWLENRWVKDPVPAVAIRLFGERTRTSQSGPLIFELEDMDRELMPNMWLWFLVFFIYVALIGPGTMVIVKRSGKPLYAWVMIPGWILLATVVIAVMLGSTFGHTFPLVHDIAYIYASEDASHARVIQGTAVTAPQSPSLRWSTSGYLRPLWGMFTADQWRYEGTPFPMTMKIEGNLETVETGKPQGVLTWGIEGLIPIPEIMPDVHLSMDGQHPEVNGTIWSQYDLENVSLIWSGQNYQKVDILDKVPAFTTLSFSSTLTMTQPYWEFGVDICGRLTSSNREPMIKPVMPFESEVEVETICYLTASTGSVPFPSSDIAGTYSGESCLIFHISCPQQQPGILTTSLIGKASANDGGWIDAETGALYPNPPSSQFSFHTPDFAHYDQALSLTLRIKRINPSSGATSTPHFPLEISALNWQGNLWEPLKFVESPEDDEVIIMLNDEKTARYFNLQEKRMDLQIAIDETTFNQYTLAITGEFLYAGE